jgi:glycerophosphoryl diester phosphodiesterase
MSGLGWLTARPIAHRGLHDAAAGVIENTAEAFAAAMAGSYAIECDLQISADGEAMVHHDDALGRLTEGNGRLTALTAAEIKAVPFKGSAGHILTLDELCAQVAGRVPLVIELKSRFDGDLRLAGRAVQVLAGYGGPAALMSFDPTLVAVLRKTAPALPRGIVAEGRFALHTEAWQARPHFIAYALKDLPAPAPLIARGLFGLPLLSWTVRTETERRRASRWADQIIFEGWRP